MLQYIIQDLPIVMHTVHFSLSDIYEWAMTCNMHMLGF